MSVNTHPYKNIVFEGGGVKGIAYAGALKILEDEEILAGIENVAGTSAGAITSALVALNYSASEIHDIIMEMNFKKFEDGFSPFRLISRYGLYKGDVFLKWLKEKFKRKNLDPNITFEQLKQKGSYKNLKVFATDLNAQSIQEFSALKTPKAIVAEAVRASMSIPLFFKAWKFTNQQPNNHIYVDGGVLFNYPIEIFKNLDETLGFYLANLTNVQPKNDFGFWSPSKYIRSLFDTLLKSQNIAFEQNRAEILHTIIINDLNVSATDFALSDEMKNKLVHQGEIATKKFLHPNEN